MPDERVHRAPGRFWFADEPDRVVPGHLDLSGKWPRVELLGALTPFAEEQTSPSPGVRRFGAAAPREPRTVFGEIMGPYRRVTLLRAQHRRSSFPLMNFGELLRGEGLQEESLEGTRAIIGAHVADPDTRFPAARFRIVNQDAWLSHSGLSMEIQTGGEERITTTIFRHSPPEPLKVPLPNDSGTLSVHAEATVAPPRVAGAYVLTKSWLQVENESGYSLDTISRGFVTPTSALLTMLYASDCPPIAVSVRDVKSGRWCEVHMPGLVVDPADVRSSRMPPEALLNREELGLERLAAWFPLVERMSPLPQLVAGAVEAGTRTVQNVLLELATAAEGVHRRLYPNSRRLSEEEKVQALNAIQEMDLESPAKTILCNAMGTYLWDLSYPMRLKELAKDVSEAIPGVTGETTRWATAIVEARNGFAHGLAHGSIDQQLLGYYVLHNSLRWLLVGRMLLELDVPAATLAARFAEFEPYRQFTSSAQQTLPRIYATP